MCSLIRRPWLSQEIEKEIGRVLNILQSKAELCYEDDGSNIRIPSKLKGQFAQLTEFTVHNEPVEVIISDKVTSIKAKISLSASRRFTELQGRRVTEGTRGSLIQIYEFEIVATHLGPRKSQLTLFISDFDFVGAGGNGTWGCPRAIEQSDKIRDILDEFGRLRSNGSKLSQISLDETQRSIHSIVSQTKSFDENEPRDALSGFATQIPLAKPVKHQTKANVYSKPKDPTIPVSNLHSENGDPQDVLSQLKVRDGRSKRSSASLPASEHGGATETSRHSKTEHEYKIASLETKLKESPYDPLYKLLAGKSISKTKFVAARHSNKSGMDTETIAVTHVKDDIIPPKTINLVSHGSLDSAPDDSRLKVGMGDETMPAQRLSHTTSSPEWPEAVGESPQQPPAKIDASSASKECVSNSNMQDTRSTEKSNSAEDTNEKQGPKSVEISANDDKASILKLKEDPWSGMSRISRRNVMIPKAQQRLLDQSDSWLPPQPGTRAPTANIPLSILEAFTSRIDYGSIHSWPRRPLSKKQKTDDDSSRSTTTSVFDMESESNDDSDVPVSSEDWPPSSPLERHQNNQLPPDSSFGELEYGSSPLTPKSADTNITLSTPKDQQYSTPKSEKLMSQSMTPTLRSRSGSSSRAYLKNSSYGSSVKWIECSKAAHSNTCSPASKLKHDADELHPEFKSTDRIRRDASDESDFEKPYSYSVCRKRCKTQCEITKHNQTQGSVTEGSPGFHIDADHNNSKASEINQQEKKLSDYSGISRERCVSKSPTVSRIQDNMIPICTDEKEELMTSSLSYRDQLLLAAKALSEPSHTVETQMKISSPANVRESELQFPSTADFGKESVLQVNRTPYSLGQTIQPFSIIDKNIIAVDGRPPTPSRDQLSLDDVILGTYSDGTLSHNAVNKRKYIHTHDYTQTKQSDKNEKPLADVNANSHSADLLETAHELSNGKSREVFSIPSPPKSSDLDDITDIEGKRRVQETDVDIQNVTKRRKRLKISKDYKFSQESPALEDPKLLARQQRREFFSRHTTVDSRDRDQVDNPIKYSQPKSDKCIQSSNELLEPEFRTDVGTMELVDYNREPRVLVGEAESTMNTVEQRAIAVKVSVPIGECEVRAQVPVPDLFEAATKSTEDSRTKAPLRKSKETVITPINHCSLYERFQEAYDAYKGSEKHFIAMCHKIHVLLKDNRMEHRSLWDDFIIRHYIEYRQYLLECTDQADNPIPYEQYYRDEIDEPMYTKRVITPGNLREVVSSKCPVPNGSVRTSRSTSLLALSPDHHPILSTPSVHRSPVPQSKSTPTVDLISDNEVSSQPSPTPLKKSSRRLPWSKTSNSPSKSSKSSPRSIVKHPGPSLLRNPSLSNAFIKPQNMLNQPISSPQAQSLSRNPHSSVIKWLDKTPPTSTSSSRNTKDQQLQLSKEAGDDKAQAQLTISSSDNDPRSTVKHPHTSACTSSLPQKWYLDPSNPFRAYARADASLKSENGNSWAVTKIDGAGIGATERSSNKEGSTGGEMLARRRELNILTWEI